MTEYVRRVAPVVDRPAASDDDARTVLVVGAGPVGLAAAGELARQGARVRLIDALPAPTTESRAIVVHPRTLVSAHPTLKGVGPSLLPAFFSHDQAESVDALKTLRELDADTLVPGHGPTWYGPIGAAADAALEHVPGR